jgi:hypothetical protein
MSLVQVTAGVLTLLALAAGALEAPLKAAGLLGLACWICYHFG